MTGRRGREGWYGAGGDTRVSEAGEGTRVSGYMAGEGAGSGEGSMHADGRKRWEFGRSPARDLRRTGTRSIEDERRVCIIYELNFRKEEATSGSTRVSEREENEKTPGQKR